MPAPASRYAVPRSSWRALLERTQYRLLRRIHRPGRRSWWSLSRSAVSRGVAVGLFFGVITPVAQLAFAIPAAIALRANVGIAALCTLVSNPLTIPFLYLWAYRFGTLLAPASADVAEDARATESAASHSYDVADWPSVLIDWFSQIALPFVAGLVTLAAVTACAGYFGVQLVWRLRRVAEPEALPKQPPY
jgi:uncharacterized protein (DUF2062 family)